MKLTLSSGGGFTGLTKEHSIDTGALDDKTHSALMEYMNSSTAKPPGNVNEQWLLDDNKEVPIDLDKMDPHLVKLYNDMRSKLAYVKR